MSYVGRWVFHSIGAMNENDEMIYMGAEEYLDSPMLYIDETDAQAVADEIKERKQIVGGQIAVCEDGKMYMLMPLPEGVSQAEVDAAVSAGHIKIYDGMMTDEPKNHAFVDGNKRIGVFTLLMTLQLNNVKIKYTQAELISLGLSVADGKTDYDNILSWVKEHVI